MRNDRQVIYDNLDNLDKLGRGVLRAEKKVFNELCDRFVLHGLCMHLTGMLGEQYGFMSTAQGSLGLGTPKIGSRTMTWRRR